VSSDTATPLAWLLQPLLLACSHYGEVCGRSSRELRSPRNKLAVDRCGREVSADVEFIQPFLSMSVSINLMLNLYLSSKVRCCFLMPPRRLIT